MPSLLDPVPDEVAALLRAIANPWIQSARWPVWQYVHGTLAAEGLDADRIWREMPTWNYNYRSAYAIGHAGPQVPSEEHRVLLTMHGWLHSDHENADTVTNLFLAALRLASEAAHRSPLNPNEVSTVVLNGDELFAHAQDTLPPTQRGGPNVLGELIDIEPITSGLSVFRGSDDIFPQTGWTWTLSRLRLKPFAFVQSGHEYLQALEPVVLPPPRRIPAATDPLALPRALDHLDVVWKLTQGGRKLVQLRKATAAAELALPANSGEEFQARLAALADVLLALDVPAQRATRQRPLSLLQERLQRHAPLESVENLEVTHLIANLNAVVDIRHGQQHSDGAVMRAREAAERLGVSTSNGDWTLAWEQVRAAASEAIYGLASRIENVGSSLTA